MKNTIERFAEFFSKMPVMRTAFIFVVLLYGTNIFSKFFVPLYSLLICDTIFLLCVIFLFFAFLNHNKNVQKGLMGAVLIFYLYDEINYVVNGIMLDADNMAIYSSSAGIAYIVLCLITIVLFGILFINHFIINSDHHSRPVNVFINQLLIILIGLLSLAAIPCQMPVVWDQGWSTIVECTTWQVGLAALVLMFASYEAHLNAYKLNREAAGWTEEEGYPKGYVRPRNKK